MNELKETWQVCMLIRTRAMGYLFTRITLEPLRFNGLPCGLVARISGFHPEGPGSIPGMGTTFCHVLCWNLCIKF